MKNLKTKYSKLSKKFLGNIFRQRIGWEKKLMKFLKFLYLLFLLPIEILGDLFTIRKRFSSAKLPNLNKILIVKTDQFGDVLFSTFLIPLIKKEHKAVEIHYLINPKTSVLLEKNPYIDKLYFWEDPFLYFILGRKEGRKKVGFLKLLKDNYQTIKLLRREKYDLIINARAFVPSNNFFFKLMKPKFLTAFDISEQSFLADFWAEYDFYEEEWKNYLKLLQPFIRPKQAKFSPQFYNFNDLILGKRFLKEKETDRLIIISPISFDKERLWKINYWQKLVEYLINQRYYVILTGLPSQKEYLLKIAKSFSSDKLEIFTDLTIPQLASLIKFSKFVICIDSFITHLTIAVGKPLICLVNPKVYFLKGLSQRKKFIDTKSMVPLIKNVKVLSTLDADEKIVIKHCQNLINQTI